VAGRFLGASLTGVKTVHLP